MPTTSIYTVQVRFSDCGPDNTVMMHNYSLWMEAASEHYFRERGVSLWSLVTDSPRLFGAPLLETSASFFKSASHPDILQIHTQVDDWQADFFVQSHRVLRGATLICKAREVRAFCTMDEDGRSKVLPVPQWIRSRCR